ncbi:transporter associated domain-containing protein [Nonomuraea rubra]
MRECGHSRYPVVGQDGDVTGVTGVRELLASGLEEGSISAITRPALLVPDSVPLPAVLDRMRAAKDDIVCVIDEYGGLAGVITIEDLAEELVGELVDENDPEPVGAVEHPGGIWEIPGSLRLDEVERATGVALPESDEYDTLAGLVLARLGRMPDPGDTVTVPIDANTDPFTEDVEEHRAELTVISLNRRVPEWVRLTPLRHAEATSR